MRYCETAQEPASDADALVLVTEWREFYNLDLAALARSISSLSNVTAGEGTTARTALATAAAAFAWIVIVSSRLCTCPPAT
jgi:hypothetical protein